MPLCAVHGGRRQPMCDPEGCSTVWGAVGGGGPHPPPKGRGGGAHPPPSLTQTQQSGGQNQKRPTSGQGGYITRAASGVPTASERGTESEVALQWARWLHNPCRLGDPHRFRPPWLTLKQAPISQGPTRRPGQGQNPFLCFSAIFEISTNF